MIDFSAEWTVESDGRPVQAVTLPHDAMIYERRDPRCKNGANTGWFPGGRYTYRKTFEGLDEWRDNRVALLFEGAYHRSAVLLNGHLVGGRPSGYAEFFVDLDEHLLYEQPNELVVTVDTTDEPNSRWYSGSGLYRRVWLEVHGPVRIARDGVRFRTMTLGDIAEVEIEVMIDGADTADALSVIVELKTDSQVVARCEEPVAGGAGSSVTAQLEVPEPKPWSADDPFLYELVVSLRDNERQVDERRARVGIRTLSVDSQRGLQINGVPTKLRGGCVHHDSGILGAATFKAAELRRARGLKDAGFNALRTGHSPMSRDLLEACDEVGLYVMDELTDVWTERKTKYDYGLDFREWWSRDLESLVAKARNHACVIMYSIGNENGETATPEGIEIGRAMADRCRQLDPTRPVTAGVNPSLNGLARIGAGIFSAEKGAPTSKGAEPSRIGSALFNVVANKLGPMMNGTTRVPFVERSTRGIFESLDVAGYNYGTGAYRRDGELHPGRVVLGTETLPGDIVRNWNLVEELPYLIGDFIWTAADHLGEAGIAGWTYGSSRTPLLKPYPYISSGGGCVDLIGQPGAMALHAQAAWGLRNEPAIVVRPLDLVGKPVVRALWRSTDALASWTWDGFEGTETEVRVYSAAAAVELLLNGRSLGQRPAGREHDCTAVFPVTYAPGKLVALTRDAAGTIVGQSELATAGPRRGLRLTADRDVLVPDGQDLAFVEVEITDEDGTVVPVNGIALHGQVTGAASLAGFGSADPAPVDSYTNGLSRTYRGRALAVLRASSTPGEARLVIASDGYGEQSLIIALGR